jgi:UPF0716 family protein affecting phage T7 exclusion
MPWWQRIISTAGGLLLIYPGLATDVIGVALVAMIVILQFTTHKAYQRA